MNKEKVLINIRGTFWFMPAVYGISTVIIVILISLLDSWLGSILQEETLKKIFTEKDTAKKLYSTLVTAILTMTTLSFSVIMVVLTTYATEFSPRILQNFMNSRYTQHVLGIYCSGFIFALLFLFLNDKNHPIFSPILMVLIAIINLGAFVYFIHHSARFLQVNNLIAMLEKQAAKIIDQLFKQEQSYKTYPTWNEAELINLRRNNKTVIKAKRAGYVQNIQWEKLINWANKHNCVIELHIQPGSYFLLGIPMMTIWSQEEVEDDLHTFITVGNERSDIQDFEFTIQKIEEIALRAISPSTNDPHTAINCINRVGNLLSELGEVYEYTPYLTDADKQLRIIHQPMKYEDYLYKSFYQLRYYGQDDISIIYAILEVLDKIALVSHDDIKKQIWQFHYYIIDVVSWDELSVLDQAHLQEIYDRLKIACEI